jgi:glycine reductase complex component B subunit gamma
VVTNLVTIAEQVGAPRIVPGRGIPYPSGDPSLSEQAERGWRRRLVARALDALGTQVAKPTVFEVNPSDVEEHAGA